MILNAPAFDYEFVNPTNELYYKSDIIIIEFNMKSTLIFTLKTYYNLIGYELKVHSARKRFISYIQIRLKYMLISHVHLK